MAKHTAERPHGGAVCAEAVERRLKIKSGAINETDERFILEYLMICLG